MKTAVRETISLAIGLPGLVLAGMGLNGVIDIGTCASGGAYVVARPCPDGADGLFWMSFVGAIAWIVAIIVSRGNFVAPGAGQALWVLGFAGGGAALLVKTLTDPALEPDAKLGASIVAWVFLPMGLAVGVVGIVQLVRRSRGGRPQRTARSAPSRGAWSQMKVLNQLRSTGMVTRAEFEALRDDEPGADRIDRIHRLAGLRESGTLSTGEFERRKRSVLAGLP